MSAPKQSGRRFSKRAVVLLAIVAAAAGFGLLSDLMPQALEVTWTYLGLH